MLHAIFVLLQLPHGYRAIVMPYRTTAGPTYLWGAGFYGSSGPEAEFNILCPQSPDFRLRSSDLWILSSLVCLLQLNLDLYRRIFSGIQDAVENCVDDVVCQTKQIFGFA